MLKYLFVAAVAAYVSTSFVARADGADIMELTADNFEEAVEFYPIILVHFYSPNRDDAANTDVPHCPLCEEALANLESAAAIFKDSTPAIKFAKMDATVAENKALYEKAIEDMHRPRLPMMRAYKSGEALPYGGSAFSLDYTVEFLEKVQSNPVEDLLGPKKIKEKLLEPEGSKVVEMSPENFNTTIAGARTSVVTFIQPSCGGCKEFAPAFSAASVALADEGIALGKVDLTEKGNKVLCRQSGCTNGDTFPIIKVFHGLEEISAYSGPRDEAGFTNFVKALAKMHDRKLEASGVYIDNGDDGEGDAAAHGGEL